MSRSLPHVALSERAHDRHGALRRDEDWLEQRWQDPGTRVLVMSGARLRPVEGKVAWIPSAQAPVRGLRLLLGERDGVEHFALVVAREDAPGEPGEWVPLRDVVMGLVDDTIEDGPLVMHAIGMAEWHAATTYCPRCGDRLEPRQAGHVLHSPTCGRDQFPRSDPAVIMLVTDGEPGSTEERALLGRSPAWPAGRYSTLAGFVEPGETMEDAVRREVAEETGVGVGEVAYFGSQPWPMPASLMVGFTARAVSTAIDVDGSEIEDAAWFTRAELRARSEAGTVVLPRGVSISRSLIEDWYGGPLTGQW